MLVRRYGRLPILFWSQVIALGFLIGCTFAPNFNTFAGMQAFPPGSTRSLNWRISYEMSYRLLWVRFVIRTWCDL
jgi:hypothetical protein